MALCRVAAASCPLSGAVHTGAHIDLTPYTLPALCAARRSGHHVPPPPPPPPTDQPSLSLLPSAPHVGPSVRPSARSTAMHTAVQHCTAAPHRPAVRCKIELMIRQWPPEAESCHHRPTS